MSGLRATRYEYRAGSIGEYWVYFEDKGSAVFADIHNSRTIEEWITQMGIDGATVRWSAVSFKNEEDAMLCLLAFR